MSGLRVLSGGLLTTAQDQGRRGAQRWGVPGGGAMDQAALLAANLLLDNPPDAAALEITAGGAAFAVDQPTVLAVTGADLGVWLDDQRLPLWTAVFARSGATLRFTQRSGTWGARAYLAVAGGFDLPLVLHSRSTYLPGGFGGLAGRSLRMGDALPAGAWHGDFVRIAGRVWPQEARPGYTPEPILRVLPGPHSDLFDPSALEQLYVQRLRVGVSSNRIGYRLEGIQLRTKSGNLRSLGVVPGVIQVPPDGAPILLMADAQPTGGYPIAGVVIGPDLPLAAQLLPGDLARLRRTTQAEARTAWQACASRRHIGFVDATLDQLAVT